jgi:hypothetical protein
MTDGAKSTFDQEIAAHVLSALPREAFTSSVAMRILEKTSLIIWLIAFTTHTMYDRSFPTRLPTWPDTSKNS